MAAKPKNSQLHIGISDEDKVRWAELGRRFGYKTTSEFVRAVLCALSDRYESEGWASGILHLEGNQIVGPVPDSSDIAGIYAFPVAAPARLWRYLEALSEGRVQGRDAVDQEEVS